MKTKEEIQQYKKDWAAKNKEKIAKQQREHYLKNSEIIKERSSKRFADNKEEISEKQKVYYQNNKEKITFDNKEYLDKNKDVIYAYRKEYNVWKNAGKIENFADYYKNNKDIILEKYLINEENKNNITVEDKKLKRKTYLREYNIEYGRKRKSVDDLYKLTTDIRSMITGSFNRNGFPKISKTNDILGCSFEEFKIYLESKFEPWMNWTNRGNWNGYPREINVAWDIDHIIPLSLATNEKELIKLNHHTNLQPLCSYYNRHIKSGKVENYKTAEAV